MTRYHRHILLLAACLPCNMASGAPFLSAELDPATYSISRTTSPDSFDGSFVRLEETFTARVIGNGQTVPIGEATSLELRLAPGTGLEVPDLLRVSLQLRIGDLDAPTTSGSIFYPGPFDGVVIEGDNLGRNTTGLGEFNYLRLDEGQARWVNFRTSLNRIGDGSGEPPVWRRFVFTFTLPDGPSLEYDPELQASVVELAVSTSMYDVPADQLDSISFLSIVPEPASSLLLAVMGGSLLWRRRRRLILEQ